MLPDTPNETLDTLWPSCTYQVQNGRIMNRCDGLTAMRQAVDKILQTPRFSAPYLTAQYGHDIYTLIGKNMSYAMADIGRIITEALEVDERILSVTIIEMTAIDAVSLQVSITVNTIYGAINTQTGVQIQ